MTSRFLTAIQIGLGLVSAVALVVYGAVAATYDLAFWLFAALFLVFIGFDITLHVRALRPRGSDERPGAP